MSNKIKQTQKRNSSEPRNWQKKIKYAKDVENRIAAFKRMARVAGFLGKYILIDPKEVD